MNELNVIVKQQAAVISANFDEIKNALTVQMEEYRGLVYNSENVVDARKDVATLRKIVKAIDSKRKEVKKDYMIPYDEFENKAKELISIINDAIDPIDNQIKAFEEEKRQERKIAIENYFTNKANGNEYVCIEDCWDDKWLSNMSTSMKSIRGTIDSYIENIEKDISTIEAFGSDVTDKAIEKYVKTKQLSDAINIIQEHDKMKAEIIRKEEEKRKKEEELRHQAELERVRREEAERIRNEEEERKRIVEEALEKAKQEEKEQQLNTQDKYVTEIFAPTLEPIKLEPISLDPLPSIEDDIPFLEELKPIEESISFFEDNTAVTQHESSKEEKINRITELLINKLSYAYCDNCGTEDCEECHRKSQSWSLSESTALGIAEHIVNEIL